MWCYPLQRHHLSFSCQLRTIWVRNLAQAAEWNGFQYCCQSPTGGDWSWTFAELLLDNSTAFRYAGIEQFAKEWGILLRFRASYASSGNCILERNHRTIKRIAARGDRRMLLSWRHFDTMLRHGKMSISHLFQVQFCLWAIGGFLIRLDRSLYLARESVDFPIHTEVWDKTAVPSCTKKWSPGRVTGIQSAHVICVDGLPRHVRDVSRRLHQGGVADA